MIDMVIGLQCGISSTDFRIEVFTHHTAKEICEAHVMLFQILLIQSGPCIV